MYYKDLYIYLLQFIFIVLLCLFSFVVGQQIKDLQVNKCYLQNKAIISRLSDPSNYGNLFHCSIEFLDAPVSL